MGKKRFSGWSVVAAMFLFSFFATAIYSNCLSLYMHPVCDSLQLSSTTPWSMINLIAAFASAGGAMAIAGLYQGKHFKLFMLLCIAASGCIVCSGKHLYGNLAVLYCLLPQQYLSCRTDTAADFRFDYCMV